MRKRLKFLIISTVAITCLTSLPVTGEEIKVTCKTTHSRKSKSFSISNDPPEVIGTVDFHYYDVIAYTPTKLVFRQDIDHRSEGKYLVMEITHTINRTNLSYQENVRIYSNWDEGGLNTGPDGHNYTGKCYVDSRNLVLFSN